MNVFMWGAAMIAMMGIAVGFLEREIAYGICLGIVLGVGQAWMLYRAIDRWAQGRVRGLGWGMRLAVHGACIALVWRSAIDIAWWAVCIGVIGVPMIVAARAFHQLYQK
jgi:hypothetical protein